MMTDNFYTSELDSIRHRRNRQGHMTTFRGNYTWYLYQQHASKKKGKSYWQKHFHGNPLTNTIFHTTLHLSLLSAQLKLSFPTGRCREMSWQGAKTLFRNVSNQFWVSNKFYTLQLFKCQQLSIKRWKRKISFFFLQIIPSFLAYFVTYSGQ